MNPACAWAMCKLTGPVIMHSPSADRAALEIGVLLKCSIRRLHQAHNRGTKIVF